MIALHLHPIHNAVGIRFRSLGWDGKFAFQAMTLENGQWVSVLGPEHFDRDLLEQPVEDSPIVSGQFELRLQKETWLIRHRGGNFGKCTASAMKIALEKARVKATNRGEGGDASGRALTSAERVPIPIEVADDTEATAL
jgi:hypothetical protein